MDAGGFEQLKHYLKENLSVLVSIERTRYGSPSDSLVISLGLEGQEFTNTKMPLSAIDEDGHGER